MRSLRFLLVIGLSPCCAQVGADAYDFAQTIEAGCFGGIIGFVRSVTVHRDGRVDYLFRPPGDARGPNTVEKEQAADWFERLEAAAFYDQPSAEREPIADGIYCGISLIGPQSNHSLEASAELDPRVRQVFDEIVYLAPVP